MLHENDYFSFYSKLYGLDDKKSEKKRKEQEEKQRLEKENQEELKKQKNNEIEEKQLRTFKSERELLLKNYRTFKEIKIRSIVSKYRMFKLKIEKEENKDKRNSLIDKFMELLNDIIETILNEQKKIMNDKRFHFTDLSEEYNEDTYADILSEIEKHFGIISFLDKVSDNNNDSYENLLPAIREGALTNAGNVNAAKKNEIQIKNKVLKGTATQFDANQASATAKNIEANYNKEAFDKRNSEAAKLDPVSGLTEANTDMIDKQIARTQQRIEQTREKTDDTVERLEDTIDRLKATKERVSSTSSGEQATSKQMTNMTEDQNLLLKNTTSKDLTKNPENQAYSVKSIDDKHVVNMIMKQYENILFSGDHRNILKNLLGEEVELSQDEVQIKELLSQDEDCKIIIKIIKDLLRKARTASNYSLKGEDAAQLRVQVSKFKQLLNKYKTQK